MYAQLRKHAGRAAWAVAEQGVNPLVQLAITPILLRRLGTEDYAAWIFGIAVVSMSQLISLGTGGAVIKHVSADLGAAAKSAAIAVVRAALAIALSTGAAATLLAWWLGPWIAARFFSNMGDTARLGDILRLCGAAVAVQELDNVFAGALRGAERYDLAAKGEVVARMMMGCILAYLAVTGSSVRDLFLAMIEMMFCKATIKGWQVAAYFGSGSCCRPSIRACHLRRILEFGIWQWLQSAGTVLFSVADRFLVGGLLGAEALTRYGICLQIAQYVHMLPAVMMQIIFPRLSALGRTVDARRGNQILRTTTLVGLAAALMLGIPMILFARSILTIWIGPGFAVDNSLLLIVLILVHVALAVNIGPYYVLLGTGRTARLAVVVLLAGAAQTAFAVVAAPFGILAVACNRFMYSLSTAFLYAAARYKDE